MAKQKEIKTNAMRILDRMKIPYTHHTYTCEEFTSGIQIADLLSLPHELVYKTLVTVGASRRYYVFDVPVNCTLSLKKAAHAVGEKSVAMLPQKELLPLTGYIHGGCSPLGMKKLFPTCIDETAQLFDTICVSAGRRGLQVELRPDDLCAVIGAAYADLTE